MEHIIAAKAVCFAEALQPEFITYGHQIALNAKALAKTLMADGLRLVSGGTDNHLMLIDCVPLKSPGARFGSARGLRHLHQPQYHSLRSGFGIRAVRDSAGHARAHHARNERKRNDPNRPADRQGLEKSDTASILKDANKEVTELTKSFRFTASSSRPNGVHYPAL